jgi:hypothetical protein
MHGAISILPIDMILFLLQFVLPEDLRVLVLAYPQATTNLAKQAAWVLDHTVMVLYKQLVEHALGSDFCATVSVYYPGLRYLRPVYEQHVEHIDLYRHRGVVYQAIQLEDECLVQTYDPVQNTTFVVLTVEQSYPNARFHFHEDYILFFECVGMDMYGEQCLRQLAISVFDLSTGQAVDNDFAKAIQVIPNGLLHALKNARGLSQIWTADSMIYMEACCHWCFKDGKWQKPDASCCQYDPYVSGGSAS